MKFRKYEIVTDIKDFKTIMVKDSLQLWGKSENENKLVRIYLLGVDGTVYHVLKYDAVDPLMKDLKNKKLSIIKVKRFFFFTRYYMTPTSEIKEFNGNSDYDNKTFTIREEE